MGAPALRAGAVVVGGRDLLPRALAALALALLGLVVMIVAPLALLSKGGGAGPGSARNGIPAAFVPLYRQAARVFGLDWLVLASIHAQETGFSTNPTTYHGVNSAGCCAGPFQMNITNGPPSTWDTVKAAYRRGTRPASYPHSAQPHPSVYDDFDAAMAAGALLRANGADRTLGQRTWNAVRAYNGTGPVAIAYANSVMARARAWAQSSTSVDGGGPGTSRASLIWPVRGPVSSPFCERRAWEACHPGIDIAVPSGTPILAAATGRVSILQTTNSSGGYGNFTCLQHTRALSTCYAHQQRTLVRLGQLVTRGQPIGTSDCSGRCFGPHLHFEVRLDDQPICPARYLGVPSSTICAPGAPGA
jgi:murein DD-endopeptidase MepM/ murein hydrolase activator NlpD